MVLAIVFVLVTETFNTALEAAIDLISPGFTLWLRWRKMWRRARFAAAVNALVTAYFVLFPKLNPVLPKVIDSIINSPAI